MWVVNEIHTCQYLVGCKKKVKMHWLSILIETAPHLIVEATVDARWGGGCPFGSDIYEQGQVPGRNVAGVQLTEQRDSYIEEDK